MKSIFIPLICTLSLTTPLLADVSGSYPPNPYDNEGGQRAPAFSEANSWAIHFINLIDQYQYSSAWLEAGGLMRDVITQDQWTAAMDAIRTPLGPNLARKVSSHQSADILPYGTHGNFMIIQYDASFANLPSTTETITLYTEGPLAIWKVISYNLRGRR